MKNLDCNQINIFYQLRNYKRRRQEKKIISILKKICNLVNPFGAIMASKFNFYYKSYNENNFFSTMHRNLPVRTRFVTIPNSYWVQTLKVQTINL